jgi:tetratricopeptide (TPR) repeat protein
MRLALLLTLAAAVYASPQSEALRMDAVRLEQTVHEHPDSALAHYELGIVYRELGDNRSATINLQAAIRGGFDNLGARLNLMEAAFASKHSALALESAHQIISPAVKSQDVLLRVGRLLFDHLFYKEALRAFQLAQQMAPGAFEPAFRLALTQYLLEDYAATIATLKPGGVLAFPSSPEATTLEASAEAELGHFAPAVSQLRAVIKEVPDSPHAYINLALIELDRGNTSEAESILERFRLLGSHSDAKVFYRIRHNSCPDVVDAMKHTSVSVRLSREKGEFYYQLAKQLQKGFNFLSAVELARLAQAEEGNSARVLLVAGASCLNQDPTAAEAVLLLQGALAQDPNLHEAYSLLGRAYAHQGKLDDAIAAYRRAVELHPEASYHVSLGKLLQNRQSALAEFQQALMLDSSFAQAHLELGRTYVDLGELENGRLELEKAIELEPDFYEAEYLLGRLLHQLGEEEQSHQLLKLFADNKAALMQQSVIQAGYVGDGR